MPKSVNGFNGLLDIPTDYQAHHQLPQQLSDNPFLKQLGGIVDLKDFSTDTSSWLASGLHRFHQRSPRHGDVELRSQRAADGDPTR
jgi:hypothetical protein